MKKLIYFSGALFATTLAVVVGLRLSADAMAVVVGIICGMVASIPMSAVLVWTLRLRDKQLEAQIGLTRGSQYPPVVVVNGQGATTAAAPPMLTGSSGPRQFKIIGQESTEAAPAASPIWEEV